MFGKQTIACLFYRPKKAVKIKMMITANTLLNF